MKKKHLGITLFSVSLLVLVSLFSYGLFWAEDPKKIPSTLIGKKAPNFQAVSFFTNEKIQLSDFSDKPLVVNFFASWCLPCKKESIALNEIWQENKDRVYILGIALNDTQEAAENFLKEQKVQFPAIQDDELGNISLDFGVTGIPETFFINKRGIVIEKIIGVVSKEQILSALNKL